MKRIWVFILLGMVSASDVNAQRAEYDGGSIYNLDPAATQATGNRILEQIFQSNDMERVSKLAETDELRKRAKPVGRLAVQVKGRKVAYCTASLVAPDLIITNHHCIPGSAKVEAAQLWMGYLIPRSRKGVAQYAVDLKPVEADKTLDYAILRVQGAPGNEWGTISLSNETPADGQSLFVIHHPGGFAQHITRGRCQTATPATEGDDLLHICDTLGGSSGAPIFDNNSRRVIGLHYSAVGLADLNAGKSMAMIVKKSSILSKLLISKTETAAKPRETGEGQLKTIASLRRQIEKLKSQTFEKKTTITPADGRSPALTLKQKVASVRSQPSWKNSSTHQGYYEVFVENTSGASLTLTCDPGRERGIVSMTFTRRKISNSLPKKTNNVQFNIDREFYNFDINGSSNDNEFSAYIDIDESRGSRSYVNKFQKELEAGRYLAVEFKELGIFEAFSLRRARRSLQNCQG